METACDQVTGVTIKKLNFGKLSVLNLLHTLIQRAFIVTDKSNIDPDDFINLNIQLFLKDDNIDSAVKYGFS